MKQSPFWGKKVDQLFQEFCVCWEIWKFIAAWQEPATDTYPGSNESSQLFHYLYPIRNFSCFLLPSGGLKTEIKAVGNPPLWLRDTHLSSKVGSNFAYQRRSFGRYSSLAGTGHGVFFYLLPSAIYFTFLFKMFSLYASCTSLVCPAVSPIPLLHLAILNYEYYQSWTLSLCFFVHLPFTSYL
jgi:hypothetical protein